VTAPQILKWTRHREVCGPSHCRAHTPQGKINTEYIKTGVLSVANCSGQRTGSSRKVIKEERWELADRKDGKM
jgi:hypothetical protein